MPSTTCTHNKEAVVLHYYGELDESASAEMDVRLKICPSCKEYYADLVALEAIVPRSPSVEPDETVMRAIRAATARRLMQREGQPSVARRLSAYRPVWIRVSVAFTALVLVFLGGRWSTGSSEQVQPTNSLATVDDVSDIVYDPQTGTISVEYSTLGASAIRGPMSDARVRALVTQALMDDDRPATRYRAVSMLNEVNFDRIQPDQALVAALATILRKDANEGVQIQAIKALRRINAGSTLDQGMTELLIKTLEMSKNSALRIAALEMLTESELARQDLALVLSQALSDENGFIRIRAQTALDDLEDSVPLDQVQ